MKNKNETAFPGIRRLLAALFLFFASFCTDAQSITWCFVNAAGFEDGEGASLNWTMGEPITLETIGEEASMRVGFLPFSYVEEFVSASTSLDPEIRITLSPNPASDVVRIEIPGDEPCMIRILSFDGRSRLAADIVHAAEVDIQSLPEGAYVLYVIKRAGTYNSIPFIKS